LVAVTFLRSVAITSNTVVEYLQEKQGKRYLFGRTCQQLVSSRSAP